MRLNKLINFLLEEEGVSGDNWDRATDMWFYEHPGSGFSDNVLEIMEANAIPVYEKLVESGWWCPGNCELATRKWKEVFEDAGIPVEVMNGFYSNDHEAGDSHMASSEHVWLEVDGGLFDPTAGQFSGEISLKNYWLDDHSKAYESSILMEEEDYRGVHRAPGKEHGAPLWDVTKDVYPDDIYTLPAATAARYYGASEPGDIAVMSIIQSYHNKPNRKIKIYRSVPDMKTIEEEIFELEGYLKQMLRRGRAPKGVSMSYDEIYARKEKLKADLERGDVSRPGKIKDINPGDWVSIYRPYVVEHGEGALGGEYVVLSKTVYARDLYTDGNSMYEWGWDPT